MSHVAAMLTNLISNRKYPNILGISKTYDDPNFCHVDDGGQFESADDQLSSEADQCEHESRSGSSTSGCLDLVEDIANQGDEAFSNMDECSDIDGSEHRNMPLNSADGPCPDDELSATEYEEVNCYNSRNYHYQEDDLREGLVDEDEDEETCYLDKSADSPSEYCPGSPGGYSVSDDQYPDNSNDVFYRNENLPKSLSCSISSSSSYRHFRERDKNTLAPMMESTLRNSRKATINKAPFLHIKSLKYLKNSCLAGVVLLPSRPCYKSPVSTSTVDLHCGPRTKFRHLPGSSIRNSYGDVYTRASLKPSQNKSKSRMSSRLVRDDNPFQSSHIYSSGQFGFLSRGGESCHDIGKIDKKHERESKIYDLLRKEVRRQSFLLVN